MFSKYYIFEKKLFSLSGTDKNIKNHEAYNSCTLNLLDVFYF